MPKPVNTGPQWVGPDLAIKPGMHPLVAKAILYRLGFELLGTGACASAFKLGQSNRVVKLVCDRAGHRAAVDLFMEHPEVEAFPTIFAYTELTNDCFIYETELLHDSDHYEETQFDPEDYDEDDLEDFTDDLAGNYGRDAAELVIQAALDGGFYFDLHSENVMDRDDGTTVIIDPYHRFWSACPEGRAVVRSGHYPQVSYARIVGYWANVAKTVPYRGATTTALVPLVQA